MVLGALSGQDRVQDFVQWVRRLSCGRASDVLKEFAGREFVTLSTIHQAKGLEWPVVVVARFNAGVLPLRSLVAEVDPPGSASQPGHDLNPRPLEGRSTVEILEEERRLAYVAMSRARTILVLSYSLQDHMGEPLAPSPFLQDIPGHLTTFVDGRSGDSVAGAPGNDEFTTQSDPPIAPARQQAMRTKRSNSSAPPENWRLPKRSKPASLPLDPSSSVVSKPDISSKRKPRKSRKRTKNVVSSGLSFFKSSMVTNGKG